ncbi:MAG: endonuclease [Paludibacteraceae bacterium]|nr:endonuclease [Paludibacteraceae bacterium]
MTLKRFSLFVFLYIVSAIAYAAIPSGYYTAATGSGATLKTQLYNIINGHTERSYAQLWTDFQTTDAKSNGKVWDMYSDIPNGTPPYEYTFISDQCGNYSGENSCYNREHSFPKSWFNDATPMYSDLFHLYPTDGYVNGQRGNLPFGEVNNADWTSQNGSKKGSNTYTGYSGVVFEPIDEYKGDFARTYFYMATRYENVIAEWYTNSTEADAVLQNNAFPVYETWFLNMLGEWHVADPVSQKEIDRNDAVYGIQNNRNPYIDHPEYVYNVWGVGQSGSTEPANYPTNVSTRNLKLQWTDATGAVTPEKYLIRMSATGFNDIAAPTDGISYSDSSSDKNVNAGVQQVWFTNLSAGTYYFKIYGYTGSGATANYKTDGVVPQYSVSVP